MKTAVRETNQERFIHYLSHDLREPARMVSQFLKLVKERSESTMDKKSEQFLEYAIDASQKMDRMIQSLSDISRVRKLSESQREVNVLEIVNQVKDELSGPIEMRNAQISYEGPEEVFTRKTVLRSILKELLSNSLQHAECVGDLTVQINAQKTVDGIEFTFIDNGEVISEYWQEKAFELFQKKDQNSLNTGIGLTKCRILAQKYQGNLKMIASDSNKTVVNCVLN